MQPLQINDEMIISKGWMTPQTTYNPCAEATSPTLPIFLCGTIDILDFDVNLLMEVCVLYVIIIPSNIFEHFSGDLAAWGDIMREMFVHPTCKVWK